MTTTMTMDAIRERLQDAAAQPTRCLPAVKVQAALDRLLIEAIETAGQVAPREGCEDWSTAERESEAYYSSAAHLIGEALRRYAAGAVQDGRTYREAAESMGHSLHVAVTLALHDVLGGGL